MLLLLAISLLIVSTSNASPVDAASNACCTSAPDSHEPAAPEEPFHDCDEESAEQDLIGPCDLRFELDLLPTGWHQPDSLRYDSPAFAPAAPPIL